MKYTEKATVITETHLIITEVLDGDSIKVSSIFGKNEKEIRLYGIDCPENKYNRKMKEDEKKLHIPAEYLFEMGVKAHRFVLSLAPVGTSVTIQTEKNNEYDYYKRQLAYVFLPDGSCLNKLIVQNGYAKATSEYFCEKLQEYEVLQFNAMQQKQGLFEFLPRL